MGDGGTIPNFGQSQLNLIDEATSSGQVARPLMSVGRICDNGMKVEFTHDKAVVTNPEGAQVCVFERKPGGLYTCKFRLKSPMPGFTRQG